MRAWKQGTALLLTVVLCIGMLVGCSESEKMSLAVAAGGEIGNLDPIYATEPADQTLLMNLYENLMRAEEDGAGGVTATPGIAKSVKSEVNFDGTVTYTFHLSGTEWSDGEQVTAEDFVYAWRRLADPVSNSPYASLLSVVMGYDEVQESGDTSILQVSAKDENTLVVVLNGQYEWFLNQVCTSPATLPLREDLLAAGKEAGAEQGLPWWSDVTGLVTNGPYIPEEYVAGESLRLVENPEYRSEMEGPGELTFRFADTAEDAWSLYEEKDVDFVWELPQEKLEKQEQLVPELGTAVVMMNCNDEILGDPDVRRALMLSIDRQRIAEAAGKTAVAAEGLVPFGVPGGEGETGPMEFRSESILLENGEEIYEEDIDVARKSLRVAGFADGREIQGLRYLYEDTPENQRVAAELTAMWKEVLHLEVEPVAMSGEELEAALAAGDFDLAGRWVGAAGNDAECFLAQWTTKSRNNLSGYSNNAYDTLMSVIASAEDGAARMACLHDAELLLMDEGAVAPLYGTGTAWQLRENLTGLYRDARGWSYFANVVPA